MPNNPRGAKVACWLPDCLVWAGHRLGGRISAACLEALLQCLRFVVHFCTL